MPPKKTTEENVEGGSPILGQKPVKKLKAMKKNPKPEPKTKATKNGRTINIVKVKISTPKQGAKKVSKVKPELGVVHSPETDAPLKYGIKNMKPEELLELTNDVIRRQLSKSKNVVTAKKKQTTKQTAKKPANNTVTSHFFTNGKESNAKKANGKVTKPKKTVTKPKEKAAKPKAPRVRKKKAQAQDITDEEIAKAIEFKLQQHLNSVPSESPPRKRGRPKKDSEKKPNAVAEALTALRNFGNTPSSDKSSPRNSVYSRRPSTGSDRFEWVKEISSSPRSSVTAHSSPYLDKVLKVTLVDCLRNGTNNFPVHFFETSNSVINTQKNNKPTSKRKIADDKPRPLSKKKKANVVESSSDTDSNVDKLSCGPFMNTKGAKTPSVISKDSTKVISVKSPANSLGLSMSTTVVSNIESPTCKSPSSVSLKSETATSSSDSSEKENFEKINTVLRNLKHKLNSFDMEFINWLGSDKNEVVDHAKLKSTSRLLKLEAQFLASQDCQNFQRRLSNVSSSSDKSDKASNSSSSDTSNNSESVNTNADSLEKPEESLKPAVITTKTITPKIDDREQKDDRTNKGEDIPSSPEPPRRLSYDPNAACDDDDALSLYAESITGIESSRIGSNSFRAPISPQYEPDFEIYNSDINTDMPEDQLVDFALPANLPPKDVKTATVCEKQNADSTSVPEKKLDGPFHFVKKLATCSQFIPLTFMRSYLFKGVCFFNLLYNCKKNPCLFRHEEVPKRDLETRISRMTDQLFISEYLLLNKYLTLRNKYLPLFVDECKSRGLSRILVEMAIHACSDNQEVKVHAIETALLHLNETDFDKCEDLLNKNYSLFSPNLVCEEFMEKIANTQNFSRFKKVFIKLTDFIISKGKTFDLDVTKELLERISILPYEKDLAVSLIKMIKYTSVDILKVPAMDRFMDTLQRNGENEFNDLLCWKNQCLGIGEALVPNMFTVPPPPLPKNFELPTKTSEVEEKRYTSPDTTHLDSMQINQDPPRLTRTIETGGRPRNFLSNLQIKLPLAPPIDRRSNRPQPVPQKTIFDKVHLILNKRNSRFNCSTICLKGHLSEGVGDTG